MDKEIDTDVSYRTSSRAISFICRNLGIDKSDFINISVETMIWIASEIARGRKIFSSEDAGKVAEYEYPTGNHSVENIINRRIHNITKLLKEEESSDEWLRKNFENN